MEPALLESQKDRSLQEHSLLAMAILKAPSRASLAPAVNGPSTSDQAEA
jgi:hypothetical protein